MRATGVQNSDETLKEVVLGVDTHLDVHVAVVLDGLGRCLGESRIPTTLKGYGQLLRWAQGFGVLSCAGVEGTGSYGAGLARYLRKSKIAVFEVERPKRRHLRREAKSDLQDAESAARAVLSGEAAGVAKSGDGRVEMIRVLRAARRSAVKAKTQAANQLQGLRGAGRRAGRLARPSARATDEGTGGRGCPFSPRSRSDRRRRGGSDQARAAFGSSSL